MNYWIIKAQLTAIELDVAQKNLLKAYRRGAPDIAQHQQRWDSLANEMHELNGIDSGAALRTENRAPNRDRRKNKGREKPK